MADLTVGEKQELLVTLQVEWVTWVLAQGWKLRPGEGRVLTPRRTRDGRIVPDGVHMAGSLHYLGLAQDWNLFVGGEYKKSDCPEWQAAGAKWESLHSLARWGGRFETVDLNHFSIAHDGKA